MVGRFDTDLHPDSLNTRMETKQNCSFEFDNTKKWYDSCCCVCTRNKAQVSITMVIFISQSKFENAN